MKKIIFIILVYVLIFVAIPISKKYLNQEEHGTGAVRSSSTLKTQFCKDEETGTEISYLDALVIAQKNRCNLEEEYLPAYTENYLCNQHTGTWWVDLILMPQKPGCNPSCVVDIVNETAEINWRCTGAIPR